MKQRNTKFTYARVLVLCCPMLFCSLSAHANIAYPFLESEAPITAAKNLPAWFETIERARQEEPPIRRCTTDRAACPRHMRSLRVILERGAGLARTQQVRLVNKYVNRFKRYRTDKRQVLTTETGKVYKYQQWVTLGEFLQRGGDCEDYATSKYQILRLLGIEPEYLRVLTVYDYYEREYHALLAVQLEDGSSILLDTDNRIFKRRPARYRFVYALNENFIWDHDIESVRSPRFD